MSTLRIFHTRLRQEEKLLFQAAQGAGIPCSLEDARRPGWEEELRAGDVALCRCIGHGQNVALARILQVRGVRPVNLPAVMEVCGDKIATSTALDLAGIAQPGYRVALSEESALQVIEEMGYPVVLKPATGSWGRLLARVNDRDAAEAILEHKFHLGAQHQVFYIQEYVTKAGCDIRAFVVGGEPLCAISRQSEHWITNTARGANAEGQVIDEGMDALLRQVHAALGGDFLAVDLFPSADGWLVNEVNDGCEFRNSIATTGVNIPEVVVRHCWELRGRD